MLHLSNCLVFARRKFIMYLSIPPGKVFRKVDVRTDAHSEPSMKDCFVDLNDDSIIVLQDLIKDALKSHRRGGNIITLKEFTIYLKTPPNTDDSFLTYTPNHNGKHPTDVTPQVVVGKNVQKYNPAAHTKYGSFWHGALHLPPEKRLLVEQKMLAQKEDRQHIGDSPKAT